MGWGVDRVMGAGPQSSGSAVWLPSWYSEQGFGVGSA